VCFCSPGVLILFARWLLVRPLNSIFWVRRVLAILSPNSARCWKLCLSTTCIAIVYLATFSHLAVPNHDQDGRTILSSHGDSSANHGRHSTDHSFSSAKTQTPRYLAARYQTSNVDCRLRRLILTSVCLSCTYGQSREQRGLGRLKVATDSDTTFKVKRSNINLQGRGHIVAASHKACFNHLRI